MTASHTRRSTRVAAFALASALVVGGIASIAAPSAHAFGQAVFHTQSTGNRGVDTTAVQYLLQARGYTSVAADGNFGSGTKAGVVAFQQSHGLTADGVVGPATWAALVTTVQSGSTGPAVKAVQVLLNKKRGAGLVVDGSFGPGTLAAVKAFQTHAGISVDGSVGPTTWKNLVWHFATPSWTYLCDQNPDGNTYANWGTGATIGQLEAAAASFASTGQGKLPVGDISNEHGGDIVGHVSHELGVDADVWPIRTDNAQCTAGRITWQSSTYDRAATRTLVQKIRATAPGQVALIYFNDPVLIGEGLTTQYPNHDNHLHIRYQ